MKLISTVMALAVSIGYPNLSHSTAMMEPGRNELKLAFDNGDSLSIWCPNNAPSCSLSIKVNGKKFEFTREDFNGLAIYPDSANLYSGPASGKDRYFSFAVSIECPEELMLSDYDCHASVLVQAGKPIDFKVIRTRTDPYIADLDAGLAEAEWSYYFTDSSKAKLEAVVPILKANGYGLVYIASDENGPNGATVWTLWVKKVEAYSSALLAERKLEFHRFATEHDLDSFSGLEINGRPVRKPILQ